MFVAFTYIFSYSVQYSVNWYFLCLHYTNLRFDRILQRQEFAFFKGQWVCIRLKILYLNRSIWLNFKRQHRWIQFLNFARPFNTLFAFSFITFFLPFFKWIRLTPIPVTHKSIGLTAIFIYWFCRCFTYLHCTCILIYSCSFKLFK